MEGQGRVRLEFLVEFEVDAVVRHCGDFGAVQEASRHDVEDLAGFGAQDAGEVQRLLTGEGGVRGVPGRGRDGVGDPAAAHRAVGSD